MQEAQAAADEDDVPLQDDFFTHEKDIFVTAVRRKYIPPLMECYQDMLVISVHNYEKSATE